MNADTRPALARLTFVELRKMTDTRAGFWLQLVVVLLTVAAVVLVLAVGANADRTFEMLFVVAVQPASILLPVVGVLLVTSEWSQRTAMVTFALVPQRTRVVAAKLLAGVVLALLAAAACIAMAALGTAIAGTSWELSAAMLGQNVLSVMISLLLGLALGAALLASAPAIVANFALPLGFAALGIVSALRDPLDWLDLTQTLTPMAEHVLSAGEWARVGTSLGLWLLVPLAIGLFRITRGEMR
jgi:ABC-type transport system involved in multi-copper enzyme maturation permease subunit